MDSTKQFNVEHLDAFPIYVDVAGKSFTTPKFPGIPAYEYVMPIFHNGTVDWLSTSTDIEHICKAVYALGVQKINEMYLDWKKQFKEMLEFYYCLCSQDFTSLSTDELIAKLKEYLSFYYTEIKFPGFIDAFMFYADTDLFVRLQQFVEDQKVQESAQALFSLLSAPIAPSFFWNYEQEITNLSTKEEINQHLQKYSFIKSSYAGYKEYTKNDIQKMKQQDNEKNHSHAHFTENQQQKNFLFAKYILPKDIITIAKQTEILVLWQDERKIYTLTHIALDDKFLSEISRRFRIPLSLLRYCSYEELLEQSFAIPKLQERSNSYYLVKYQNGSIIERVIGEKAARVLRQAAPIMTDTAQVHGLLACLGKVRGKICIINNLKDIDNVQEGDVLVTGMTRPEHILAMKKAAAIVTDDGGITCHASIISRELKKPCIIGTKIATKIFKNGDLVEVDATKGIVRKINDAVM